ncbi:hypothetical protein GOV12_06680 [Candidatus Pacearchaeota archaeon]|nr:hypothetical protein [Candidatus Pacearchaeota archaeon]
MRGKYVSGMLLIMVVMLGSIVLIYAAGIPSGATLTPNKNETAPADPPGSISAFAGNVTEMNIDATSTTKTWQGYYGNITGVVELTDGSNNTLYNWTVDSPNGEVYASNESGVIWTNIMCFNFTANGTGCLTGDIPNRGGTSACGTNLTQINLYYNINETRDVDGVNDTFNRLDHDLFYTNSLQFSAGECPTTRLHNNVGTEYFQEILLWSPDSNATVFASKIYNDDASFDEKTVDFEMIVLEDGHGTDEAITTYYFYAELE